MAQTAPLWRVSGSSIQLGRGIVVNVAASLAGARAIHDRGAAAIAARAASSKHASFAASSQTVAHAAGTRQAADHRGRVLISLRALTPKSASERYKTLLFRVLSAERPQDFGNQDLQITCMRQLASKLPEQNLYIVNLTIRDNIGKYRNRNA